MFPLFVISNRRPFAPIALLPLSLQEGRLNQWTMDTASCQLVCADNPSAPWTMQQGIDNGRRAHGCTHCGLDALRRKRIDRERRLADLLF